MNAVQTQDNGSIMEQVLVTGDLSKLTPQQRSSYYMTLCKSLNLNPLTKPFDYITLNGRLVLYAKRDAGDQLRKLNGVSVSITDKKIEDGIFFVTVKAVDNTGRYDEDMGAVSIAGLKGDALVNATLKAITKAKRRVTLSICGLGMLDETEIDTIPDAKIAEDIQQVDASKQTNDKIALLKKKVDSRPKTSDEKEKQIIMDRAREAGISNDSIKALVSPKTYKDITAEELKKAVNALLDAVNQ